MIFVFLANNDFLAYYTTIADCLLLCQLDISLVVFNVTPKDYLGVVHRAVFM